jgi:hypothetical protein
MEKTDLEHMDFQKGTLELYRKEAEIRAHIVAVKQYYAKL